MPMAGPLTRSTRGTGSMTKREAFIPLHIPQGLLVYRMKQARKHDRTAVITIKRVKGRGGSKV